MADHHLSREADHVHYDWDRERDPVLSVDPGDSVRFDCWDAADNQLPADDPTVADLEAVDAPGHALTGPVAIEGAEPGDTLAVDILDVEHDGIGWTYVYPGEAETGLLPGEFPDGGVHVWDLDGDAGELAGVEVPLHPFPGNLGVVPAAEGPHSTIPPRRVGGNLDVKHLAAGATLYLPVEVAGGLFSVGDLHGAQGDGEVCITAIEVPGSVTCRFRLAERDVDGPELDPAGPYTPAGDGDVTATTGLGDSVDEATREAVRAMIRRLTTDRDLARLEAYMLCSVAVDLKVSEVVNGTVAVTAYVGV